MDDREIIYLIKNIWQTSSAMNLSIPGNGNVNANKFCFEEQLYFKELGNVITVKVIIHFISSSFVIIIALLSATH